MEVLVGLLGFLLLLSQLATLCLVIGLRKRIENTPKQKEEPASVTDPFHSPKEVYSSTAHIVVPKSPIEIRNQNFDKIKKGIDYGDPFER